MGADSKVELCSLVLAFLVLAVFLFFWDRMEARRRSHDRR